jgi:hypothetical protein
MGAGNSKCKCLYLPAQSGKTRKMQELIRKYKLEDLVGEFQDLLDIDPVDINIIISANNRLLVEQTRTRMENDLAIESEEGANDACIKGNVFSWTSGTKQSNISPEALTLSVMNEDIEMVVICSHPTRIRYLFQTLELLTKQRHFNKKINIWIDEADKSIKLWSKYDASILSMDIINQVTLVSATFDTVLSKYKCLNVLPYLETHPECYRGLRSAIRHEINFAGGAVEYVKNVIQTNRAELVRPGVRAFIPGEMKKKSHDEIADFLHRENGFVVLIINGERKEILVPGQSPIDLRCYLSVEKDHIPKEFNAQLARLYKENQWHQFPLAITGFYCVERGVTFQCGPDEKIHDGFMFDYGIIPPIACAAEAYQTMARLFGNIGHIVGYKPVDIYSNTITFARVEKKEEIAINIARLVAEQGIKSVDKTDVKAAQNFEIESQYDLHQGEFRTLREASIFMKHLGARGKKETELKKDERGFYHSSTTGKVCVLDYSKVKAEMSGWSKLSNFDVKKNKLHNKTTAGRLYVCYKDTSDCTTAVFIACVLTPILD